MALPPTVISDKRRAVIEEAEGRIDEAIGKAKDSCVSVAVRSLGITREEWERELGPKYRAAGWVTAKYVLDQRDGDFIDLQAR